MILFPFLIVMFMALVQWGLYFHAQSLVDAAAQDAARAGQDLGGTTDDGRDVANGLVADAADSGLLAGVRIDVSVDGAGMVRARVTGTVRSLVPLPMNLAVEGRAAGPREAFTPEPDR